MILELTGLQGQHILLRFPDDAVVFIQPAKWSVKETEEKLSQVTGTQIFIENMGGAIGCLESFDDVKNFIVRKGRVKKKIVLAQVLPMKGGEGT